MQPNGPWQAQQQYPQQQQYGQSPYGQQLGYVANPYAAPAPALYRENGFVPHGAVSGPLPNPALKKVKLAIAIAQLLFIFGGMGLVMGGAFTDTPELAIAGSVMLGLGYLCVFATMALTMYWNYVFWAWVPPDQRWTNLWKKYISPGTLIGFMFIPYFNIYWMFVTYIGITDVLERMRVRFPHSRQPNLKSQAIMTLVVGMFFFPAAPLLQYFFQKKVEEMAIEMSASMPRRMI